MQPIPVKGTALCSITYKKRTIPVEFFIVPGPILDGFKVAQLKIITMDKNITFFNPMKMLKGEREVSGEFNFRICSVLERYTENFQGLGKMND